jgi:hypothetical protein
MCKLENVQIGKCANSKIGKPARRKAGVKMKIQVICWFTTI